MRASIGGLVFDLDGTIVDTSVLYVETWRVAFEATFGINLSVREWELLYSKARSFALPFHAAILQVARNWGCRISSDAKTMAEFERLRASLVARWSSRSFPLMADARAAIDAASRLRVPLAICTNSPACFAVRQLSAHGLLERFLSIPPEHDALALKPSPDRYLAVLKTLRVPARDVAVVEDSLDGALAAVEAGAGRVFVRPSAKRFELALRQYGLQAGNTIVPIKDLNQMKAWIVRAS